MLGIDHTQPCSATVKVALILAPHVLVFAKVLLGSFSFAANRMHDLDGEGVRSRVVHASGAQPPPHEQIRSIEATAIKRAVERQQGGGALVGWSVGS